MKFIFSLLILIGLSACEGSDKVVVGNKTTMEIELIYDAGDVLLGEMITAKYTLTNTGDFPLTIASVTGSCTCTVAEFPEDPVLPGESASILAHVNTDKTGAGIMNKSMRIVANTEPSITQILVKANVRRK